MTAWKLIVPSDKWYPDPDDSTLEYKGCLIVVVATTAAAARERAREYLAREGRDVGWLKIARCSEIPLIDGAVLAYAEV